ncbi:MAG: NAD-binding protein [Planctomycetota bacterium]
MGMDSAGGAGRRSTWQRWRWPVVVTLAVLAIVLGIVGHLQVRAARGEPWSVLDCAYFTLQQFFLMSGTVRGESVALEVARWLAPAVAGYTVWVGLATLFRRQFDRVRLRLGRGHVVVCGLGEMGRRLASDLAASGERVVAIERAARGEGARRLREAGVIVLAGDASDRLLLRRGGVARARAVVVLCGDDGTNVEVAVRLHDLLSQKGARRAKPLQCYVHVADLRLCRLFRDHRIFTESSERLEARIINMYETGARLLFLTHALERDVTGADDPRGVHLVVVGCGQMGESVVLQAARLGHFANGRRLRVTVVDQAAEAKQRSLQRRYPGLGRACDVTFVDGQFDDPETPDAIVGWARDPGAATSVAVCFDDDSRSVACALSLLSELGDDRVPIFVRMGGDAGLAKLFDASSSRSAWAEYVDAFGLIDRVCTRRMLMGQALDRLARAIHASYLGRRQREGQTQEGGPLPPWERLPQHLKASNRHQADHIPIKLRAVGCVSGPPRGDGEPVDAFSDDEVELLARMEHARWSAERWLEGWTPGPRDPDRKTTPYLVPYDELPQAVRDYDRQTVREIPALLDLVGQKIYRANGARPDAPTT